MSLLNRVVDGEDTIDADIVLGFGVVLKQAHSVSGVDTPEVHSDDVEKGFGLRAKAFVGNWCAGDRELILVIKVTNMINLEEYWVMCMMRKAIVWLRIS